MNPYVQYMYSYPHKTAYRPLEGVCLDEYAGLLAGKGHGLYLHVPFCQGKCGYCNLFSVTGQDAQAIERYLDGVERQSRQYQELLMPYGTEFSEFTIGGGTPLLLSGEQLEGMFALVRRHFALEEGAQIGIETAPNQTERGKLELLKQEGVCRVSMGIQSFFDEELGTLRRGHRANQAREALGMLMSMGFPRVNVDFIYGIPGQTVDSLQASLREAVGFGVDEIFLYPLYVKHGAGLVQEGVVIDPEYAYLQYREMCGYLRAEGFRQDSMRRFVRKRGRKAQKAYLRENGGNDDVREAHLRGNGGNDDEWRKEKREFSECGFGTSLALGCGGRSYVGRLHFCTPYAVTQESCLEQLRRFEATADFSKVQHGILLSEEEQRRRYVIRHLLIRPGIALRRYEEAFGSPVLEDFPVLKEWTEKGWLQEEEAGDAYGREKDELRTEAAGASNKGKTPECFLTLTEEGMGLSDYLGPMLASGEVWGKMKEWEAVYEPRGGFLSGEPEKL